jgi:hypothetical protein
MRRTSEVGQGAGPGPGGEVGSGGGGVEGSYISVTDMRLAVISVLISR